jgi:cyclopropane fatty-acyl-phospholipid synthase-like methyltransferase
MEWLLRWPAVYNLAQGVASANYRAARSVIRQELMLAPGEWLIDLGCGTGNLAGLFPDARYVGVDLSLPYLRFARRAARGNFAVMDVARLGFREDTFDAAIAIGLTHHLDDGALERFAGQVRRVCRATARMIVIDIVPAQPWNLLERARQRWGERGKHLRPQEEHRRLLAAHLAVEKGYRVRSGFLEYSVLVLRVEKETTGG